MNDSTAVTNDLPQNSTVGQDQTPNIASGKNADRIVECLRSAVVDGAAGLTDVPQLVKRVIAEELWRVRATKLDAQPKEFATFSEFVRANPPAGLGTDLNTLLRLCDSAPDALDLLIQQMPLKQRGGDRRSQRFKAASRNSGIAEISQDCFVEEKARDFKSENFTIENHQAIELRQHLKGAPRNSRQYSLRRLRDKNPDLYQQVLRNNLSTNEAMIASGLRRPQFSVSAADPIAAAAILAKKFDRDDLQKIVESLNLFLQAQPA